MKVGFIGSGKVGISFGMLLKAKNVPLSGYYSRHIESSEQAAKKLACHSYETLEALVLESDLIGITVNDDQIDHVVAELNALNVNKTEKIFFHMSGAHDCISLKKLNAFSFSLHPLKAFPQVIDTPSAFESVIFSLEGATQVSRNWVDSLEINYFEILSSQKALYHAAAVIVSNYLVTVIDFGLNQFTEMGVDKTMAKKALWPLITGTLSNIEALGTEKALTGPIVRGDCETIEKHLSVMNENSKTLYKALGKHTLTMTQHDEALQHRLSKLFEEANYDKSNNNDLS
jgi:predicted short-subunit dehydrogenase-like oxidoreductase (DUF2520 family)